MTISTPHAAPYKTWCFFTNHDGKDIITVTFFHADGTVELPETTVKLSGADDYDTWLLEDLVETEDGALVHSVRPSVGRDYSLFTMGMRDEWKALPKNWAYTFYTDTSKASANPVLAVTTPQSVAITAMEWF